MPLQRISGNEKSREIKLKPSKTIVYGTNEYHSSSNGRRSNRGNDK
jgi:hypothetical protein